MNTRTANEAILLKMQGTPDFHPARGFHPASANLFADWTLEPGDVLTVRSEGTDYAVPVYTMDLSWNGDSTVRVQSSGNKQRDPPSELARRNYGYSRGQRKLEEGETEIRAELVNQGDSIGLVVTETAGGDKVINAASIVAEINRTTGESIATINADHIILSSSGGSTVKLSDKVGVLGVLSISGGMLEVDGNSYFDGNLLVSDYLEVGWPEQAFTVNSSGDVQCNSVSASAGMSTETLTVEGETDYSITAAILAKMVKTVSVSGNTLTLARFDGTTETFSKATTLESGWSSGTYTVTAKQNGTQVGQASTTPSMQLNGSNTDNFSAELLTDDSTPAVTKSIHGYLGLSGSGSNRVARVYKDSGKTQYVAQISAPEGGGHDTVTGSEISLNGSSAATSQTEPSTAITKAGGYFSGYVWFQLEDGTWKNLRSFRISMPGTSTASWTRSAYGTSGQYMYSCTVAGTTYTHVF